MREDIGGDAVATREVKEMVLAWLPSMKFEAVRFVKSTGANRELGGTEMENYNNFGTRLRTCHHKILCS